MSVKTLTPKNQNKNPERILTEQLSLAFGNYYQAVRSERIKKGLARMKAENL